VRPVRQVHHRFHPVNSRAEHDGLTLASLRPRPNDGPPPTSALWRPTGMCISRGAPDALLTQAIATRRWLELIWNQDSQEDRLFDYDMCGACAPASIDLHHRLRRHGISAELCISTGMYTRESATACDHVFIEAAGFIVDVTATQFNKPAVCIVSVGARDKPWLTHSRFDSPGALKRHLHTAGWSAECWL